MLILRELALRFNRLVTPAAKIHRPSILSLPRTFHTQTHTHTPKDTRKNTHKYTPTHKNTSSTRAFRTQPHSPTRPKTPKKHPQTHPNTQTHPPTHKRTQPHTPTYGELALRFELLVKHATEKIIAQASGHFVGRLTNNHPRPHTHPPVVVGRFTQPHTRRRKKTPKTHTHTQNTPASSRAFRPQPPTQTNQKTPTNTHQHTNKPTHTQTHPSTCDVPILTELAPWFNRLVTSNAKIHRPSI